MFMKSWKMLGLGHYDEDVFARERSFETCVTCLFEAGKSQKSFVRAIARYLIAK